MSRRFQIQQGPCGQSIEEIEPSEDGCHDCGEVTQLYQDDSEDWICRDCFRVREEQLEEDAASVPASKSSAV